MRLIKKQHSLEGFKTFFDIVRDDPDKTENNYSVQKFPFPSFDEEENEFLVKLLSSISQSRDFKEETAFIYKYITGQELVLAKWEELRIEIYKELTEHDRVYYHIESEITNDQMFIIYNEYKRRIESGQVKFQ